MSKISRPPGEGRFAVLQLLSCLPSGLVLCLLFAGGPVCAGALDRRITLAIEANSRLEDALITLAGKAQLDIEIVDSPAAAQPVRELRGTLKVSAALATLLEGSGLLSKLSGNTLYIKSAAKSASPPAGTTDGATRTKATDLDPSPPVHGSSRKQREAGDSSQQTDEVTVTGSRIRGVSITSPTTVLDRNYIDHCACQTLSDVLNSLPQNSGGSFNSGVVGVGGSQSTTPLSGASRVNLRGMGNGATLIMVDGRRLPPNEATGGADLTQIPLAAVERIEVVTAGASASYGSDAVAGVVNIILRDHYKGVEVSALRGATTSGGGSTQRYDTTGGYGWDSGKMFGTLDCEKQNAIDAGQRSYITAAVSATTLLPRTRLCSTLLEAKQTLSSRIDAAFQAGYTRRTNGQSINIESSSHDVLVTTAADVTQYFVGASIAVQVAGDWKVGVTADLASDTVTGSELVVTPGSPYMHEADIFGNGLRSIEIMADGTLLQRHTDALKLAVGTGYREEIFQFDNQPATEFTLSKTRHINFAFAEFHIPLLLSQEGPSGPHSVTLSLAARRDRYSDVGSTSIPHFSLTYVPLRDLEILASWGRAFRAPSLLQEYNTTQLNLNSFVDSNVPSGASVGLLRFGGNPQLQPERARTASINFTFTPSAWNGASFEFTYYYTFYRARIEYPTANTGNPLLDANVWPFLQRNPSAGVIAELVEHSQYSDLTSGKYVPADATVIIDDRYHNISEQHASGVDFRSGYSRDTDIGHLDGLLNVAYLNLRQRIISTSPLLPISGTLDNPPLYRARLGGTWGMGLYSASVFLNYVGPSHDLDSSPPQRLSPWITVDAQAGYTSARHGFWGTTDVKLAARNLFNRRPPLFDVQQQGPAVVNVDWTNTSAIGCFVTLQVTQSW